MVIAPFSAIHASEPRGPQCFGTGSDHRLEFSGFDDWQEIRARKTQVRVGVFKCHNSRLSGGEGNAFESSKLFEWAADRGNEIAKIELERFRYFAFTWVSDFGAHRHTSFG